MRTQRRIWIGVALFLALLSCSASKTAVKDSSAEQRLVDDARNTLKNFLADEQMGFFREYLKEADGVVIVPQMLKGALLFGGTTAKGVLLVRDDKTREWSQPAFYTVGSVSFGFQAGGKVSEVVLLAMTAEGVEMFYKSSFKLGTDINIIAGPVAGGAKGSTVPKLTGDLISFARSQGAFAGASFEGAIINARNDWNKAYYGRPADPVDILVKRNLSNPQSAQLVEAVTNAATKEAPKTKK
jgi:lipid-binding SYLF domain-containing protein